MGDQPTCFWLALQRIFREFDLDQSGYMSRYETHLALENGGKSLLPFPLRTVWSSPVIVCVCCKASDWTPGCTRCWSLPTLTMRLLTLTTSPVAWSNRSPCSVSLISPGSDNEVSLFCWVFVGVSNLSGTGPDWDRKGGDEYCRGKCAHWTSQCQLKYNSANELISRSVKIVKLVLPFLLLNQWLYVTICGWRLQPPQKDDRKPNNPYPS